MLERYQWSTQQASDSIIGSSSTVTACVTAIFEMGVGEGPF
jgi:hypothetical protein